MGECCLIDTVLSSLHGLQADHGHYVYSRTHAKYIHLLCLYIKFIYSLYICIYLYLCVCAYVNDVYFEKGVGLDLHKFTGVGDV